MVLLTSSEWALMALNSLSLVRPVKFVPVLLALPYKPDPDLGTLQIGDCEDMVIYQVDDRAQRAMKKRTEEARGNE